MTITVAFHGSGAKTFKDFYTLGPTPWKKSIPQLSELQPLCGVDALVFDAVVLFLEHPQR